MVWLELFLAGLGEVFWSAMMKLSKGFTRVSYSVLTVIGMILSFYFLIKATKKLDLSLAYPIWTGIGTLGSVLVGSFLFQESISLTKWFFVILLLVGIIGLKVSK
ncbi:DMT family transporter [Bombilactobacillus bombi]|uniref:DMT family transporter n=1 Tax=Bombilactobacillus bombi TaxID=1303590 RepID=UPI0015E5CD37|nr:multidrug efflux SMR transporter [Bombilactobacillus bombi]MBA1435049.1 multidrug efflux SMR transporter [Bombilactobacillus bombi]